MPRAKIDGGLARYAMSAKTDEKGTKAARRQAVVFDHITNIPNKKAEQSAFFIGKIYNSNNKFQ